MKKSILYSWIIGMLLFSQAVHSQNPTFSTTQNWLTGVSFNTCMQRSKETLVQNGFSATAQSDNVSHIGYKVGYGAFLICQSCGDKTITTIVISSSGTFEDATILREKMLYYIATGLTGTSTGSGNLYTTKDVFMAGERIVVEFKNMPGNNSDWVNIVPAGTGDGSPGTWKYLEGKKSGQISFDPQAAGEYEARAFYNNSYKVEYRYRFRVGSGGALGGGNPPATGNLIKLDKTKFAAGEKIEVNFFNLPGNSSDWISIVPKGTPDAAAGNWQYTGGLKTGKLTFAGIAAGEYEIRVFYNNSYKLEERLFFKVEAP